MKRLTYALFLERYQDESACIEELTKFRWPSGIPCKRCKSVTPHHRIKSRPAYACNTCLTQTYLMKGTIFENSKKPLTYWFYILFHMTHTKSGIASRQFSRELGVTPTTAWRMCKQIRKLMADSGGPLQGIIEIDETYIGGKGRWRGKEWWGNWEERPKIIVQGMVERGKGGRVKTQIVPNTGRQTLLKPIQKNIDKTAWLMTDGLDAYWNLHQDGYKHNSVNHSKTYVRGPIYTNNIENFWSHLKRGIRGVYRQVRPKYLQSYANEYGFRYNNRSPKINMFYILLDRVGRS